MKRFFDRRASAINNEWTFCYPKQINLRYEQAEKWLQFWMVYNIFCSLLHFIIIIFFSSSAFVPFLLHSLSFFISFALTFSNEFIENCCVIECTFCQFCTIFRTFSFRSTVCIRIYIISWIVSLSFDCLWSHCQMRQLNLNQIAKCFINGNSISV